MKMRGMEKRRNSRRSQAYVYEVAVMLVESTAALRSQLLHMQHVERTHADMLPERPPVNAR